MFNRLYSYEVICSSKSEIKSLWLGNFPLIGCFGYDEINMKCFLVRIMSSYSYHAFACLQLDRFNILPRCMTTSLQHWVSTSFRLRRHRHVRRALTNRQDRACVLLGRNLLRFSLIPTFHFVTGRARVKLTFMCAQPTSALWRHTKNHVTGVN